MPISNILNQRDYSGGLVTAYEPWQLRDNELPSVKNMKISKKGSIRSAQGFSSAGACSPVLGLFPFYLSANDYLVRIQGLAVEHCINPWDVSPTWTNIETFVSVGEKFTAMQYDDKLWYGDGVNDFRMWNGSSVTTYASAPKGNVSTVWRNQAWIAGVAANPSTLYYSRVDDFTSFSGGTAGSITVNKQDGEAIVSIVPQGSSLIVIKDRSIWRVTYDFDQVTGTSFYVVVNISTQRGGISSRAAVLLNNDVIFLSNFGVISVGQEANYSGLRVATISNNIRDDLRSTTFGGAINALASQTCAMAFFEDELYISIPTADSASPTSTYVYDSLYGAWTYLDDLPAKIFCTFRRRGLEDYLFFGANDGVYYFDTVESRNGASYEKSFMTSRNSLGDIGSKKEVYTICITGTKALNSTIECTYISDYTSQDFQITDSDLIESSGGGYIGENYFGDNYFGGSGAGTGVATYRYRKFFHPDARALFELQMKFLNDNADEPYSVDGIQVLFDTLDPQESLPS